MQASSFTINRVRTPLDLETISELFLAYAAWLNIDLSFQDFTDELATLPGKYAPPTGEMLLARSTSTGEALGCVAVRPLARQGASEMKRLYVTPAGRGIGVGKGLVREIIKIAEEIGYEEMLLDTLAHMTAALGLYKSFGFVECERYYENPNETVVFLKKVMIRSI